MTPFASVALYRRNNETVFLPPRKEAPTERTQARKAAMRYWGGRTNGSLLRVFLLREIGGRLEVAERVPGSRGWKSFDRDIAAASAETHLAAALAELGIDASAAPPPMPDVIVINGFTYRRDI